MDQTVVIEVIKKRLPTKNAKFIGQVFLPYVKLKHLTRPIQNLSLIDGYIRVLLRY